MKLDFRVIFATALIFCAIGKFFADTPTVSPPPPPMTQPNPMLTSEEWRELSVAKQAVTKANPELEAQRRQLLQRMRLFEDKLQAEMMKANPDLASTIFKYYHHQLPQ